MKADRVERKSYKDTGREYVQIFIRLMGVYYMIQIAYTKDFVYIGTSWWSRCIHNSIWNAQGDYCYTGAKFFR